MKIHIKPQTILTGLLMLLLAWPFTSCDDDNDGGMPVIHHVRTTDPELRDSTFVKAEPGQMLLIEGENLGSVRKVYINDQDVYFNPNYTTSRSIIVTIPEKLHLTGTNPDLPREIRVETAGGVATYSFHVLSPAPEIQSFIAKYPINPGDGFLILGKNFYEIQKIVLKGETGTNVEVTEYTVAKNYNSVTIKLPAGVEERGELVMYCAAGEAGIEYSTTVLPPVIASFSSDMPVIGADFFIAGAYFIDVEKVNINGEYDILAEDLRVSETNDTIYLKLPSEPAASGKITVTAAGGDSKEDNLFYPSEYVILNYDGVGSYSWGADAGTFTGNGTNPPYVTTGNAGGVVTSNVVGWQGWWFGVLANGISYTTAIAGSTPSADLVMKFECFISYPIQAITFQVKFGNGENVLNGYVPKSITGKKTEIGKWMSCEIPIATLAPDAAQYSNVKALGNDLTFQSIGADDVNVPQYEVYFDNFRIVRKTP